MDRDRSRFYIVNAVMEEDGHASSSVHIVDTKIQSLDGYILHKILGPFNVIKFNLKREEACGHYNIKHYSSAICSSTLYISYTHICNALARPTEIYTG